MLNPTGQLRFVDGLLQQEIIIAEWPLVGGNGVERQVEWRNVQSFFTDKNGVILASHLKDASD